MTLLYSKWNLYTLSYCVSPSPRIALLVGPCETDGWGRGSTNLSAEDMKDKVNLPEWTPAGSKGPDGPYPFRYSIYESMSVSNATIKVLLLLVQKIYFPLPPKAL